MLSETTIRIFSDIFRLFLYKYREVRYLWSPTCFKLRIHNCFKFQIQDSILRKLSSPYFLNLTYSLPVKWPEFRLVDPRPNVSVICLRICFSASQFGPVLEFAAKSALHFDGHFGADLWWLRPMTWLAKDLPKRRFLCSKRASLGSLIVNIAATTHV